MKRLFFLLVIVFLYGSAFGQMTDSNMGWHHLDLKKDSMYGVSTHIAYENLIKGKQGKPVIVAILDSGVDYDHEDLKDIMWVNEDEIPGNGIDDDNNGYVDDIHGWNFIGGKDGENVDKDTYEVTRLYASMRYKFENVDPAKLNKDQKKEYELFQQVKEEVTTKSDEARATYDRIKTQLDNLLESIGKFAEMMGDKPVTLENLEAIDPGDDEQLMLGKQMIQGMLMNGNEIESFDAITEMVTKGYQRGLDYYEGQFAYGYNPDFDPRPIVGDDYSNSYEKGYGNNVYDGPDASHGTHVAGIVAATRNNGTGMDGIANNVKIMTVRAVPDGDERDKDVANGIIYAVDNGASIINMSFGKLFSWDKEAVDKAVKYARKHDVLLVHAAGNNSDDNDEVNHYPVEKYEKAGFLGPKRADNWMEVGALSYKQGADFCATFSNYGQEEVDIFAPGVAIYSTIPDNGYASFQGTSMAAPVVAGVAAMVRSFFPKLSAREVKEVLMNSATPIYGMVLKPGTKDEMVPFSELSVSGGVVNLHNALIEAGRVSRK
jgi:subtilisin family serine protease